MVTEMGASDNCLRQGPIADFNEKGWILLNSKKERS